MVSTQTLVAPYQYQSCCRVRKKDFLPDGVFFSEMIKEPYRYQSCCRVWSKEGIFAPYSTMVWFYEGLSWCTVSLAWVGRTLVEPPGLCRVRKKDFLWNGLFKFSEMINVRLYFSRIKRLWGLIMLPGRSFRDKKNWGMAQMTVKIARSHQTKGCRIDRLVEPYQSCHIACEKNTKLPKQQNSQNLSVSTTLCMYCPFFFPSFPLFQAGNNHHHTK